MVHIGGGITGDIQANDTALHHRLKVVYRGKEEKLMLQKLRANPDKIPSPTRDEMMTMLTESYQELNVNQELAYKSNWITNSMDGSEDHLVSQRLMDLVAVEFKEFGMNF